MLLCQRTPIPPQPLPPSLASVSLLSDLPTELYSSLMSCSLCRSYGHNQCSDKTMIFEPSSGFRRVSRYGRLEDRPRQFQQDIFIPDLDGFQTAHAHYPITPGSMDEGLVGCSSTVQWHVEGEAGCGVSRPQITTMVPGFLVYNVSILILNGSKGSVVLTSSWVGGSLASQPSRSSAPIACSIGSLRMKTRLGRR